MRFDQPLLKGRFQRRYKRFFADVALDDGRLVTAHTPNTGSLMTCTEPDSVAYVSFDDNPKRKLRYTWELASAGGTLVGVHTGRANALAAEAIAAGAIPELAGYARLRREVKYGKNSRVDILLEDDDGRPPFYVEVKNVTLGREGVAAFPDAVSARGAKHMRELADQVRAGHRAAVLFTVQRGDCGSFAPADDIDPAYGRALREAAEAGMQVLAYRAEVTPQSLRLVTPLPVRL